MGDRIKIADLEYADENCEWDNFYGAVAPHLGALLRLARAADMYRRGGRLDVGVARLREFLDALAAFDFEP